MERRTTMRHDDPISTFNAIYPGFLPVSADAGTQLSAAHRSSDEQDMLNDVVASSFNNSFVTLRTVRSWLFDTAAGREWVEARTAQMHQQIVWVRTMTPLVKCEPCTRERVSQTWGKLERRARNLARSRAHEDGTWAPCLTIGVDRKSVV